MAIYCGSRTLGHVHVPRIRNSPIFLNNRRTTGNHAPNHRPQIQFKDLPKITPKSQKKKRRITPQLMFSILRESINGLPIRKMWLFRGLPIRASMSPLWEARKEAKTKKPRVVFSRFAGLPILASVSPMLPAREAEKTKKTQWRRYELPPHKLPEESIPEETS